MTTHDPRPQVSDYGDAYYQEHCGVEYSWANPHWPEFFGDVADGILRCVRPQTVMDAGCAIGFLVGALRERGVDAEGVDISPEAIDAAPEHVAPHISVGGFDDLLGRRWDLITCIEVLEHLPPDETDHAISVLTSVTDLVLVSTTPEDFGESTHINVRRPERWAADFARRGFFRRVDLDASFLSPWAVFYERRMQTTPADVVFMYESVLAPTMHEVAVKRDMHLKAQRELEALRAGLPPAPPPGLQGEQLLAVTDRLIGLEMELDEMRYRYSVAVEGGPDSPSIAELKATETWKIGNAALSPVRGWRRVRRRVARGAQRLRRRWPA